MHTSFFNTLCRRLTITPFARFLLGMRFRCPAGPDSGTEKFILRLFLSHAVRCELCRARYYLLLLMRGEQVDQSDAT